MTDTTNGITLRSPKADELRDWVRPALLAFGEEFGEPEFLAQAPMLEPERLINAFDGEQRIATAGAITLRLTVPGGEVGASGITEVGVDPGHRRRGVLRQMMIWLLDDARARNEPVAVLWASEAAIYQRFGFGNYETKLQNVVTTIGRQLTLHLLSGANCNTTHSANHPQKTKTKNV